jgi:hypothetical protein
VVSYTQQDLEVSAYRQPTDTPITILLLAECDAAREHEYTPSEKYFVSRISYILKFERNRIFHVNPNNNRVTNDILVL